MTIKIFKEEDNRTYNINADISYNVILENGNIGPKYYLSLTTDFRQADGTSHPSYLVEKLSDLPPEINGNPSNWTELMNLWIFYFVAFSEYVVGNSVVDQFEIV
jgi:hypothetical protein